MCQIAVNFRFFMPFNFGWKAYFSARGRGVGLLFFLPAAGAWAFVFLPAAGAWGSVPNLLTKVPAFFENGGTRGQQSAFLAHFTYKSLLWQRKTGTKVGSKVI